LHWSIALSISGIGICAKISSLISNWLNCCGSKSGISIRDRMSSHISESFNSSPSEAIILLNKLKSNDGKSTSVEDWDACELRLKSNDGKWTSVEDWDVLVWVCKLTGARAALAFSNCSCVVR